jgi:acylphosphatase
MDPIARHALVSGSVQGVAFRHYTKTEARALGLTGWVKNLSDGRVEVWAEGPEKDVETLLAWLRRGPPSAHVASVHVDVVHPAAHDAFKVRFD